MKKIILLFVLSLSQCAFGWGGRGHDTICEAAVFLVKIKNLKSLLQSRPHVMGHLCNIPDTEWRDISKAETALGNPSHFFDMNMIQISANEIPLEYSETLKKYNSTPSSLGSNWWRANQFFERAVTAGKNAEFFNFFVNLGIMGHFVGDNSQPLHVAENYDGYDNGHGGIHSYFEDDVVANLSGHLLSKVIREGERLRAFEITKPKTVRFLTAATVLEKMRDLGALSLGDLDLLFAKDKTLKPSVPKNEKSMKIPAERKDASLTFMNFEAMIVNEMARGAALLARLWEEAYVKAGSPDTSSYQSPKFPVRVDFIPPDYLPSGDVAAVKNF